MEEWKKIHAYSQSFIHGFFICELTHLLNLYLTSKSMFMALSWSFTGRGRAAGPLRCRRHVFPGKVEHGDVLPSCFHSHSVHKGPFGGDFCWWFCCLKLPPSVVLPCSFVLKQNDWDVPYGENLLANLHSGRSSSAIGYEFNNYESICI